MWHLVRRPVRARFDEPGGVVTIFRVARTAPSPTSTTRPWRSTTPRRSGSRTPGTSRPTAPPGRIFADYEIIQPFPQLTREQFSVATTDPCSFAGTGTESRKLFVLTARAWRFNQNHDALLRAWNGERTVEVEFQPGYHWQEPARQAKQLSRVRVWATGLTPDGTGGSDSPRLADPAVFADLDPIAGSEVLRDVRFLTD
jgi:hypothetical protein